MSKQYSRFIKYILILILSVFESDAFELPDSLVQQIEGISDNVKVKILQNIAWENRISNPLYALECTNMSLIYAEELSDYYAIAQGINYTGVIYMHQSVYDKAYQYFLEAKDIAIKHKINLQLGYSYLNMGKIKLLNMATNDARTLFQSAQTIMYAMNDIKGISYVYSRLSELYNSTKQFDSALYYAKKTIRIADEIRDEEIRIRGKFELANTYTNTRNYNEALDIYKSIYSQSDRRLQIDILISNVYLKLKMYNQANIRANIAFQTAMLQNKYQEIFDILQILVEINSSNGVYYQAFNYSRMQLQYKDSLFSAEKKKQMLMLEYSQNIRQKESENIILKKSSAWKTHIILFFILFVMALGYAINLQIRKIMHEKINNKKLLEQNQIIEHQTKKLHQEIINKDKFFSIIAHDLKNPIGNFRETIKLLFHSFREFDEEEKMELLNMLMKSSENTYELLENLLEWSRTQHGLIQYNPDNFDLHLLASNCVELLQLSAETKMIALNNTIKKGTIVKADANLVTTILRNIVSNAIKFTPNGGTIELNAKKEPYHYMIAVSDTGIGMSQEVVDKLFNIEENVSRKGTCGESGTGLGLLLCNEFIEKHNSKINVSSEVGVGTTFSFALAISPYYTK